MNTRAPIHYEYIIVENSSLIEDEWQLVGVYGGRFLNWMVFRRHIPEEKMSK